MLPRPPTRLEFRVEDAQAYGKFLRQRMQDNSYDCRIDETDSEKKFRVKANFRDEPDVASGGLRREGTSRSLLVN